MRLLILLLSALLLAVNAGEASAAKRLALVIGNDRYENITRLQKAVNDAQAIGTELSRLGFEVVTATNTTRREMNGVLAEFTSKIAKGDTAMVFYAGHGVQIEGKNYLLPVDAAIRDQADLDLVGVEAGWILRQLYSARVRTNIVILDSCRNNPFPNVMGFHDQGLAEMNAPTGTFIAYATAPGSVALDGLAGNSPYTSALANAIDADRESIELLFKKVRVKVLETTGGAQTPWESSSLTADFYFRPVAAPAPATASSAPASNAEETLWVSVKDSGDKTQVQLYLWTFPQGAHRTEAEALLTALARKPEAAPAAGLADPTAVTFTAPIQRGEPQIIGRSIQELISSQPLFPPFEGIPDELWKGQQCSNCHEWTATRICDQAKFYLGEQAERALDKPHPLGTEFKQHLRNWALGGCR